MTSDYHELSLKAAQSVAQQLKEKPESCFGLPSGRSPLGCYQLLSEWTLSGQLDWSKARCFALDDYLDAEETKTFASFLWENLYRHTNLPLRQRFNPRFCDDYDRLIQEYGGLDLTIIGIGKNGHIAFNEPGTPRMSWTHCVWLEETTRQQNSANFGGIDQVPKRAITMGVETIMRSKQLILLASGESKKEILSEAFSGNATTDIPASFLKEHKRLQVITDFACQLARKL